MANERDRLESAKRIAEMSNDDAIAAWRALQGLPALPDEATAAVADGTSQPWTPPAEGGLLRSLDGHNASELAAKALAVAGEASQLVPALKIGPSWAIHGWGPARRARSLNEAAKHIAQVIYNEDLIDEERGAIPAPSLGIVDMATFFERSERPELAKRNDDLRAEVERMTRELAEQKAFAADCARADKAMGRELIEQRDEARRQRDGAEKGLREAQEAIATLVIERDEALARAAKVQEGAPVPPTFGAMCVEMDQLREKVAALEAGVATQTAEVNRLERALHDERARLRDVYPLLGQARTEAAEAKENARIDRERLAASGGLPGGVDRRFELAKVALRGACDGSRDWRDGEIALAGREAVELADAVLAALDGPGVARGQARFHGLFDGNLVAGKVRGVADLLGVGVEKMIETDDDVPGWVDEVVARLAAVASWLRGEGAEPPGAT